MTNNSAQFDTYYEFLCDMWSENVDTEIKMYVFMTFH